MIPFLKQVGKLVAFIKGKPYTITSEDEKYNLFEEALIKGATKDDLLELISQKAKIEKEIKHLGFYFDELDNLYYDDIKIHEDIGIVIKNFYDLYGSFESSELVSLKAFIDNLVQNPNYEAINDLFSFLQKGKLPITDDGHFLAYKKVRSDFYDIHSETFDNHPGKTIEMPRSECDLNRNKTCSTGLHFCSESYLGGFSSWNSSIDKIVEVKVNPKDVTSIPSDYNDAKGRCCKYIVIKEIKAGDLTDKKIVEVEEKGYEDNINEQLLSVADITDIIDEASTKETKEVNLNDTKTCSKCGVTKPKSEFHKRKDSKDGYKGVCKECIKKNRNK